jgi:hypothetical protein
MIKNIFFFVGGIIVFLAGMVVYGIILNVSEPTLKEALAAKGFNKLTNPNIIIDKQKFALNLYEDTVFIKSYRAVFGRNHSAIKSLAKDKVTPVGQYEVIDIDTNSAYKIFFRLNYPNVNDLTEALRKGIIDEKEYNRLKFNFYYDPANCFTPLTDSIGIHGIGRLNLIFKNLPFAYNWTSGSIAVSNESIDELYTIIKRGAKVVIK